MPPLNVSHPIIYLTPRRVWILNNDGEIFETEPKQLKTFLKEIQTPIICHGPSFIHHTKLPRRPLLDLLELFVFVHPAIPTVPTVDGLCHTLDLPLLATNEKPLQMLAILQKLLLDLKSLARVPRVRKLANTLHISGWPWGAIVAQTLALSSHPITQSNSGFDIWTDMEPWEDMPPPAPAGTKPLTPLKARQSLLNALESHHTPRPLQEEYTQSLIPAFTNIDDDKGPCTVLAEAGTGTGKTLGYLAPASAWALQNKAPVWISTYTRNLQSQISHELKKIYKEPHKRKQKTVIRKGRENYICLLNFQEATQTSLQMDNPTTRVRLSLMARWLQETQTGDFSGGDFPSWLIDILGIATTIGLSDRRGECVFTACPHYRRCYIEKSIRLSYRADIVVANHALVMFKATQPESVPNSQLTRVVFDEAHHIFDAADSSFASHLSQREMLELRGFLRGSSTQIRRRRGLHKRFEGLETLDAKIGQSLDEVIQQASCLPTGSASSQNFSQKTLNPSMQFLSSLYALVQARTSAPNTLYSLEIPVQDLPLSLIESAKDLHKAFLQLKTPLETLLKTLLIQLDTKADSLDTDTRRRIERLHKTLVHRLGTTLIPWVDMLENIGKPTPQGFVDWFEITRNEGRDLDCGYYRHYIDPTQPFATHVLAPLQGVVMTSATLTDHSDNRQRDWAIAENRTGIAYLERKAHISDIDSPFDYSQQAKVFIINDINRNNINDITTAMRELMFASGGGSLGLFTSIRRLKDVYEKILPTFESGNIPLYAQHVDQLNITTLIDIFKRQQQACLLGTDAIRDGVDVPGPALRQIIFDRVPWPRPSLLHKARRQAFGGPRYDQEQARMKLNQAFGRLIRQDSDRGIFIMLDGQTPTKLLTAFPKNVVIERLGLKETIEKVKTFFADSPTPHW